MATFMCALAALFLPLFPVSMAFNLVFDRVRHAPSRAVLLLAWPQLGLTLLPADTRVSTALMSLALLTSALYALRAVGVRDVGQWIGYLATSAWALLWVALFDHIDLPVLRAYALGFSLPLVLLALLGGRLERGFGAAYTGLYGGMAQVVPRLSGVLVLVVLAVIAAPLFPGFFAMLETVMATTSTAPAAALAVALIWLLWSWAGQRLLQGLIVGPGNGAEAADLSLISTWTYAAVLIALFIGGLYATGDLI